MGLIGGCGDDEPIRDDPITISVPEVQTGTEVETGPAETGGGASTESDGSGSAPSGGTGAPKDTEDNDTPPAPGSPEAAFEEYCEQNPGACG